MGDNVGGYFWKKPFAKQNIRPCNAGYLSYTGQERAVFMPPGIFLFIA